MASENGHPADGVKRNVRTINCHLCGVVLCELLPGAKVRKEGFYALCLRCKKDDGGFDAFLSGFGGK